MIALISVLLSFPQTVIALPGFVSKNLSSTYPRNMFTSHIILQAQVNMSLGSCGHLVALVIGSIHFGILAFCAKNTRLHANPWRAPITSNKGAISPSHSFSAYSPNMAQLK